MRLRLERITAILTALVPVLALLQPGYSNGAAGVTVEQCIAKGNSSVKSRCRDYNGWIVAVCTFDVNTQNSTTMTQEQKSQAIANGENELYEQYCKASTTATETQASAQQTAAKANQEAASASAATGVVYAAEGANNLEENPATAGTLIEAGQKAIGTAISLKEFESKNRALLIDMQTAGNSPDKQTANTALVADPKILSSPTADGIFSTLEDKYGVTRDDFIEKMLQTRGDRGALWDLLSGKISEEKFSKAFSLADELTKDEKKDIVQSAESAGAKPEQENASEIVANNTHPKVSGLRESLRKKLDAMSEKEEDEEAEPEAEVGEVSEPENGMDGLTALSQDDFFGTREPAAEELSIFDIVHRKYRELAKMMELERGMLLTPLPMDQ